MVKLTLTLGTVREINRRKKIATDKLKGREMPDDQTGSILVHLLDGTRQPLSSAAKGLARIYDGRSPSEWTGLITTPSVPTLMAVGFVRIATPTCSDIK
jgi:hypothetical protein